MHSACEEIMENSQEQKVCLKLVCYLKNRQWRLTKCLIALKPPEGDLALEHTSRYPSSSQNFEKVRQKQPRGLSFYNRRKKLVGAHE